MTGSTGQGSTGGNDSGGGKVVNLLHALHGGGNVNEKRRAAEQFLASIPIYITVIQGNAKLMRAKYEALIGEGFDEKEALTIVVSTPML